jgi:hypothetical protein
VEVGTLVRYFQYPGDPHNGKLALIVEVIGNKRRSSFSSATRFYYRIYIDGSFKWADSEDLWEIKRKTKEKPDD